LAGTRQSGANAARYQPRTFPADSSGKYYALPQTLTISAIAVDFEVRRRLSMGWAKTLRGMDFSSEITE
jgi:hypothetical protein